MTELDIQKLERFTSRIEFIWSIHMIANDEFVQTPAEFDNAIDNIFKFVCGMNIHKGDKFILETYYPTQLQHIRGRPFLMPPLYYSMLQNYIFTNNVFAQDDHFQDSTYC